MDSTLDIQPANIIGYHGRLDGGKVGSFDGFRAAVAGPSQVGAARRWLVRRRMLLQDGELRIDSAAGFHIRSRGPQAGAIRIPGDPLPDDAGIRVLPRRFFAE